jgi:hypothetical protein
VLINSLLQFNNLLNSSLDFYLRCFLFYYLYCTRSRGTRDGRYSRGWSQRASISCSDNFFVENAKHRQINAWPHAFVYAHTERRESVIETQRGGENECESERREASGKDGRKERKKCRGAAAPVWALNGAWSDLSAVGSLISLRYFVLTAANTWNIGAPASVIPYRNAT